MFQGFDPSKEEAGGRRMAASTSTAMVVLCLTGGALGWVASRQKPARQAPPPIAVTFHTPTTKTPAPPPPPPTKPLVKAKKTVRKAIAAVVPNKLPTEALELGDENKFVDDLQNLGEAAGSFVGGIVGDVAQKPQAAPQVVRITASVKEENVVLPLADQGNALPAYPEDMRRKGVEEIVLVRVHINEQGQVTSAEVLHGKEPFASITLEVAKNWKFSPAKIGDEVISFHRDIQVPFRLTGKPG